MRTRAGRPLSVLVNNAGISLNAPIETLSLAGWRQQFDVNLFGHVAMTRTLLPALMAAQGRVVNVSSIGGLVALPTYGPYAASKFAMEAFSDVLRREVGRFGVTVIVIEPGTIATDIWDKQSAAMRELSAAWTPDWHARYDSLQETAIALAQGASERGLDAADAAQVIVEAIEAAGSLAIGVPADVSKPAEVETLFQACQARFGGVDIVVANAGVDEPGGVIIDVTEADYDRMYAVNARGAFFTLQQAARSVRDGGSIIYIGSSSTLSPAAGFGLYASSKLAPAVVVRALAQEIGAPARQRPASPPGCRVAPPPPPPPPRPRGRPKPRPRGR